MSRPRTAAQALRDDPEFRAMATDVEKVRAAWPGAHVVAHRNEHTGQVTFHLHVREHDLPRLSDLLGSVALFRHSNTGVATWRFHGRRPDMDRLLAGLGVPR